jgi:hypothetical protein
MEIRLTRDEAELLRELCKEMRTLLEADIPRADPVVARLFPDAYEGENDSHAFRELVGDDLRTHKLSALRKVEDGLGQRGPAELVLEGPAIDSWLTFLTDARLAIGTRLDVTQETMDAEPEQDDPDAPAYSVLHYLGWLQEITIRGLEDDA